MSEEQNIRKTFSTSEINLYDENHSALAISTLTSYYSTSMLLEFRPLDASSNTTRYINDKSNLRFSISVDEAPAMLRQLDAWLAGDLPEFVVEHHGSNIKRNLIFTHGSAFYPDASENPEMFEKCQNSRSIYIEDVSSDDEEDHTLTVFIDYGKEVVVAIDGETGEAVSEVVYANSEIFVSAVRQLLERFMRIDFTSTRLMMSNNSGGGSNANHKPASQPRPQRPQRRGLTKGKPTATASQSPVESQAVDTDDLNSMFEDE